MIDINYNGITIAWHCQKCAYWEEIISIGDYEHLFKNQVFIEKFIRLVEECR
jgi:hypothetical protein